MSRFEIDFLMEYTDKALLAELRRIAALLPEGTPLTKPAFDGLSPKVAARTIQRRFRGWKAALEQAELGHLLRRSACLEQDEGTTLQAAVE